MMSYLFGKDGDVFIEGLWGAHVPSRYRGVTWGTCGEFAFFKNESQKWEEGMPENWYTRRFIARNNLKIKSRDEKHKG
jgi:hypothetical protein